MPLRTKAPLPADLEAGKTYSWCGCGLSQNMPLCDGSHKDSDKGPVSFVAGETKTAYLCGCSTSKMPPFCDGSHSKAEF